MSRYEARHRAPGRHKAKRNTLAGAPPWAKTFAAVTSASLGVTGAVAGGAYVTGNFSESGDLQVLSDGQLRSLPGQGGTSVAVLERTGGGERDGGAGGVPDRVASPRAMTTVERQADTADEDAEPEEPEAVAFESVLDRTAAERRRTDERAKRNRDRLASGNPKEIARAQLEERGWGDDQFSCLDSLWIKESGWRVNASNPSSGAYGIPQALPGSKMASAGADWQTNPATQIRWGLGYIAGRYGSPCGAWAHSQRVGWY